ncbi:MAG: hypothetical protein RIR00_2099 [Pseudomonadota bacterium]
MERWGGLQRALRRLGLALLLGLLAAPMGRAASEAIAWQEYDAAAFEQAQREHKLVLLELEAVWCHWCHVMAAQTWPDPEVAALMRRHYVAIRVDHDARPDLAERYREYGWPALIILDAQGRDLVKRSGFIPPGPFARLLRATVADPTPELAPPPEPEGSADAPPILAPVLREALIERFYASHDFELGGLRGAQKFLDRDAGEYALRLAQRGDSRAATMARQDLAAIARLQDPVWGGIYQYSTHGDWDHPHFEKLAFIQADYLRLAALGQAQWPTPAGAATLNGITTYLRNFLRSPEGSFYVSQDADLRPGEHAADYFALPDAARRRLGVPRVDQHRYARENGLIAQALVQAYAATGEDAYLEDARRAVQVMLETRRLPGGGFRHDASDKGGPYLGDSLGMLRALLALYGATAERAWLTEAQQTARFIAGHFLQADRPGALSAVPGGPVRPGISVDENLALARTANLLAHYSGDPQDKALAGQALAYLVQPAVALSRVSDPGILLAVDEWESDPAHFCVVGSKSDPAARALFAAALRQPGSYRRLEWWDRSEGPLPHADVAYPALSRPALYVCAERRCSRPLFRPEDLPALLRELGGASARSAS